MKDKKNTILFDKWQEKNINEIEEKKLPNFVITKKKTRNVITFFIKNIRDLSYSIAAVHDDSEDKNLSWLYNYKLNELPHLSPEVNRSRTETGLQVDKIIQEATSSEPDCSNQAAKADSNTVDNPANL